MHSFFPSSNTQHMAFASNESGGNGARNNALNSLRLEFWKVFVYSYRLITVTKRIHLQMLNQKEKERDKLMIWQTGCWYKQMSVEEMKHETDTDTL